MSLGGLLLFLLFSVASALDDELAQAIEEHKEYIKFETLCNSLRRVEKASKLVNINGKPCAITIRKSTEEGVRDEHSH